MLGEFFGMTAVSAALLDLNPVHFTRLSSMLKGLDSFRLSKFKSELNYLTYYLNNKIKLEYNSPEIKKMLRKAVLIRSDSVDMLFRVYKLDISGYSQEQKEKLAVEIEQEAEMKAKELGVKKTVVNSFTLYNKDERVTLGEYDLEVLLNFKNYYSSVVDVYNRSSSVSDFRSVTVFGRKLHEIAVKPPIFLLSCVYDLFSQPGVNKDKLARNCLEWVSIVRTYFDGEQKSSGDQVGSDYVKSSINFVKYLCSYYGIDYGVNNSNLPDKILRLSEIFDRESGPFVKTLVDISKKGTLSRSEIDTLVILYYQLFRLDYDEEFISEKLFPEGSNIVLSLDEIRGVYSRLNSIGFYCFNLHNSKLFVDSLKKISFSSAKTTIDADAEKFGYSFRRVLEDIEYFCYSVRTPGSTIEGVI